MNGLFLHIQPHGVSLQDFKISSSEAGQSYDSLDNVFNPDLGFQINSSVTLVAHCFQSSL